MYRPYIVFCHIFVLAMNSLLATTGNTMLCLHDHNFGHFVTSEHSHDENDCHGNETVPEQPHSHHGSTNKGTALDEAPHCFDIVMESSDEPVRRITGLTPVKKPIASTTSFDHFEIAQNVIIRADVRFASRAPPISCGTLEQCVRKTVLRI